MRLLGFLDEKGIPLPSASERDHRAGLQVEDAERYRSLVERLCAGSRPLAEWAGPLSAGGARVVLTGQQPALLGGPLYTLYKTLTALAAARRLREDGIAAVAAFFCVGDDTDYDEVASVSWPVRARAPVRVRDAGGHAGERIGGLAAARMRPATEQLRADWADADAVHSLVDRALMQRESADWSAVLRTLLLEIAGDEPLLFVDGNDPAVIEAAQPWLRRVAPRREAVAQRLDEAGERARSLGLEPSLKAEEARRSLFRVDGPSRRLVDPDETPPEDCLLLPNVVLRPAMQEHLLPVDRVVCGEGEVRYRLLLDGVHRLLGKPAAPIMRRFRATCFPPPWGIDAGFDDASAALADADRFLERRAESQADRVLSGEVDEAGIQVRAALSSLRAACAERDRGLEDVAASAAGKIDFQLKRIEEAARSRSRGILYRSYPDLAHLREFLLPRGRPQERSFSLLTPMLWEGPAAVADLRRFVDLWIERGAQGHALLALEGGVRR